MENAPPVTIPPDPSPPVDGTCAVCGKPRTLTHKRRDVARALASEPFCSTDCCKHWHETPTPTYANHPARSRVLADL